MSIHCFVLFEYKSWITNDNYMYIKLLYVYMYARVSFSALNVYTCNTLYEN